MPGFFTAMAAIKPSLGVRSRPTSPKSALNAHSVGWGQSPMSGSGFEHAAHS